MKTLCILQARMSSKRLPGKVLKPILDKPMLEMQINRILNARNIDLLVVATSEDQNDQPIADLCEKLNVTCFRGSQENVLDRFYQASRQHKPQIIVRLTADCPLVDPRIIDQAVQEFKKGGIDFLSTSIHPTYPDGMDVEVMNFSSLEKAWKQAKKKSEQEHVTPYIYNHPEIFKIKDLVCENDLSHLRLTVDEAEDFEVVNNIFEALYPKNPHFQMVDILQYLNANPALTNKNKKFSRNEGYLKSLKEDNVKEASFEA